MVLKEHPMYSVVMNAKESFKNGNLEEAISYWCSIYEYFERKMKDGEDNHEVFEEQQVLMNLFTNEEVYGITDYYKEKVLIKGGTIMAIKLEMTEWEANQLKAALDFLIEDSQDSSLVGIANRLNDLIKAIRKTA